MRLISRVKALAGALLLAGCLTQQAAAASFVGNRDDFRDETIYFVMTRLTILLTKEAAPNSVVL